MRTIIYLAISVLFIVSCNSNNLEKPSKFQPLTAKQKETYLAKIKTTDTQVELLYNHGFEGFKLFAPNPDNIYELGSIPKDCYWSKFNSLNVQEFLKENFKPIASKIPNFLKISKDSCLFIFASNVKNEWKLNYVIKYKNYDSQEDFIIYQAGLPISDVTPNKELASLNWDIPNDFKEFYSIHNGINSIMGGYLEAGFDQIASAEELKIMSTLMNSVIAKYGGEPKGYKFEELLVYSEDGGGNSNVYYKDSTGIIKPSYWDHEGWVLSDHYSIFEYLDSFMGQLEYWE